MHRCNICDYQAHTGSSYAGVNPGVNGKVKWHHNEFRCEACQHEITENYFSLCPVTDELDETAFALPESDLYIE